MTNNVGDAAKIGKASILLAKRQITLLAGCDDAVLHFRLIHHHRKNDAVNLFGTVVNLWPQMTAAQEKGYGVFVVVNAGGHDDASITAVRANFVDGDDIPRPDRWHLAPSFFVWRDAVHWHAYWLVHDMPVADFKAAQLRLAAHYGTDTKVCNPSRVMRLAGTRHMKDPAYPLIMQLTVSDVCEIVGPCSANTLLEGLPTVAAKLSESARPHLGWS